LYNLSILKEILRTKKSHLKIFSRSKSRKVLYKKIHTFG